MMQKTNSAFHYFTRTEFFYIFNTETSEENVIDNGGYTHHNLATYLKLLSVSTLICGGIGLLWS